MAIRPCRLVAVSGLLTVTLLCNLPNTATATIGVPIAPQTPLNSNAASDSALDERPRLATDGSGRWLAVWSARRQVGDPPVNVSDVLFSRSVDHGQSWSAPAAINPNAPSTTGENSAPFVAAGGNGVWLVVWASTEPVVGALNLGSDVDVLVARSTDDGVSWSSPSPVNTTAAADSDADAGPTVLADGNGGWRAFWFAKNLPGASFGADEDVFTARSTDNGATWSTPAAVNSNAGSDSANDRDPRAATDERGVWIVVWSSSGFAGNDRDIVYARSGDNGTTWNNLAALNTNAATDTEPDREPDIATDGAGRWLAVWSSSENLNNTGTDKDVYCSRSTNIGASWSAPQPVNGSAFFDSNGDTFPAIAAGGANEFVCVWQVERGFGGALGGDFDLLVARTTDTGATWTNPIALNSSASLDTASDFLPVIASDQQGQWIAAWQFNDGIGQSLGPDTDVLFARFALPDCNGNSIPDAEDVANEDCNANGVPDDCEPDSDGDGTIDACEGQVPGGNGNANSNVNQNDNTAGNANNNTAGNGNTNQNNSGGGTNGNTNTNTNGSTGGNGGTNTGGGFTPPGGLPPAAVPACGGCGAGALPLMPAMLLGMICLKRTVRRPRR